MPQIEAVYQGGVFKPLGEVSLEENQKVRLNVETLDGNDLLVWLRQVQLLQTHIIGKRGYFPDSTSDIAEDRVRDE